MCVKMRQMSFLCLIFVICIVDAQFGSVSISMNMDNKNENSLDFKDSSCPPNTKCMPISSCPMIQDLLDYSCFSSDRYFHRLNQLTCGNINNEDFVCCPSCDCGRVYQEGTQQCGQSMVRGVDYEGLGSQPWVARIGFTHKDTGNVRFACSGSIISKRVVLTAAHCALAKPEGYKLSTIVVGEWDIGRSPDCNQHFCAPVTQAIKVDSVIVHPGYEAKIFRHDVALIVLKDDIRYSGVVYSTMYHSEERAIPNSCVLSNRSHSPLDEQFTYYYILTAAPVCVNDKPEVVINERALLVGWGKLSGQSNQVSRQQKLEVPLVPLENCERIFGESVPVHEGQLCAGGEEGRDACSGFGGAPLLVVRDGQYQQIGIVSFGSENCGSEGVPSVYTNVAHYHRWIIENSPS